VGDRKGRPYGAVGYEGCGGERIFNIMSCYVTLCCDWLLIWAFAKIGKGDRKGRPYIALHNYALCYIAVWGDWLAKIPKKSANPFFIKDGKGIEMIFVCAVVC